MSITAPSCESLGEGRVVGRRMAGALVVGALVAGALVAGVHVVVALTHGGPVAVPDVSAYLSVAQWVGGAGLAPEGLQFHPGYGLLLAPVVGVLGADGQGLHTAALILNAIAAGAVVVVAVWLAVLCLGFHVVGANTGGAVGANAHPPRPVLWLVAGLAALHPSVTAASRIAWPETLLTLLTLGIALCLAAASQAPAQVATSRWVGSRRMLMGSAGAASGLTFLLHPRAVVLSLALCVVVVALRWARMEWRSTLSGLTVGWVLSVVTLVVTDTWPSRRLGAAASLKNGVEPIGAMAGQLIALAAGTIGLALVGLAVGTRVLQVAATSRRAARDAVGGGAAQGAVGGSARDAVGSSALGVVAVFYTVGASATIVLGGWVLTGSSRADTLLYGRYIDPWAIGLSLVAICAVSGSRLVVVFGSVWSGRLVVAFGSVLAAAAVVFVGAGDEAVREPARRIMTLSTSLVWSLVGDRSVRSAALVATAMAVAGVALTVACARTDWRSRSRERRQSPSILSGRAVLVGGVSGRAVPGCAVSGRAVLGLLALALFVGATVSNHRHLAQIGAVARGQVVTAELATRLAANNGVDCLAHDADTLPNYALWLYKLEAPQLRHEQVSFSAGQTACGPLVVATEEIKLWCDGVAQLATEPAAKWGLWRLPESSGCMA